MTSIEGTQQIDVTMATESDEQAPSGYVPRHAWRDPAMTAIGSGDVSDAPVHRPRWRARKSA